MSIRISKEHGVNPSVGLCFFCQKAKEVVLLGALSPARRDVLFGPGHSSHSDTPHSAEAPHEAIYNMEPCDECEGFMKQGIIFISVDPDKSGDDHLSPWRTGGWCVVTEDAVKRWFKGTMLNSVLHRRFSFVEDAVWDQLGLPRGPEHSPANTEGKKD